MQVCCTATPTSLHCYLVVTIASWLRTVAGIIIVVAALDSFCVVSSTTADDIPASWCGSPNTESLKDAQARSWAFWRERMVPRLSEGKTVLICGHGNIIRSMLKRLDGIPNDVLKQVSGFVVCFGFLSFELSFDISLAAKKKSSDTSGCKYFSSKKYSTYTNLMFYVLKKNLRYLQVIYLQNYPTPITNVFSSKIILL